ncbi:MAG: response regulator transcription factor [Methylococcales bacterium]|nr:response regulator transcription factor [Methylococcales bacterium]
MINLFVVDDHAIVRQGLKQIIFDVDDMQVTSEASNGDEALQLLADNPNVCDVVLLDISMPGKNIVDILKMMKAHFSKLPILILSMYPEDQYAIQMIRYGASGYLNKDSAPEQLVEAVRKVASGGRYLSPAMTEQLLCEISVDSEQLPHKKLSSREFQVFIELAKGKRITDIAHDMSRSVKTASTFRSRVMEKMGMQTTSEIVQYVIKHQL